MKKIILILLIANSIPTYSQSILGQWVGTLQAQGTTLRVVFNISKTGNILSSTMDSPDQGVKGIQMTSTSFEDQTITLKVHNAGIEYVGVLGKNDTIVGTFNQRGKSFPMNLSKTTTTIEKPIRPQEPTKPYPYYSEEVTFENRKAGITLSGTLTLPDENGVFPVVILISGSGPQNRDEEIWGHKPFLVLADRLTKNGIGVLRFDDRGTAQSTGNFKLATTLDFSTDVEAGINYLLSRKAVNKKKIGLIGHSEGAMVASMVASHSKNISFLVMLAGLGLQGNQLLLLQQELIGRASGASESDLQKEKNITSYTFDMVMKSENPKQLSIDLTEYIKQSLRDNPAFNNSTEMDKENFVKSQVNTISSPWMRYFIKYNPAMDLEKVECPVLALNGEKDLQVPPKENLEAIKKALEKGGNEKVTIKALPHLNHLFQKCKTGLPSEYATIEQTLSPVVLTAITTWVLSQVK